MVIDPNSVNNANTANAKSKLASNERVSAPKAKTEAPASPARTGDSVSLSAEALSLGKLQSAVANAPAVDTEKVAATRLAIQSGQYQIDPEAIAAKMLDQDAQI